LPHLRKSFSSISGRHLKDFFLSIYFDNEKFSDIFCIDPNPFEEREEIRKIMKAEIKTYTEF
jgi:hypothetical protein